MHVKDPAPPAWPTGLPLPPLTRRMANGDPAWYRSVRLSVAHDLALRQCWSAHKGEFVRRGWGLRQEDHVWIIQQWLAGSPGKWELTAYGRDQVARAAIAAPKTAAVARAAITPLPASLKAKLRPYQAEPAAQLLRALRHGKAEWGYPGAVDLSDMGTGKTYMALAAALATGRAVGVICPPVGRGGWERAFAHFGAEAHFISTYEAVRGSWRPEIAGPGPDGEFRWRNPTELLIILDEAQALRHDDTLTSRTFSAAVRQGVPIIMASATLALSPLELRYAGRIVGLHKGGQDWERFVAEHGCLKTRGAWKWSGRMSDLQKVHGQLFPWRGCRVRKEELGDACPETEISLLPVVTINAAAIDREWRECMDTADTLRRFGNTEAALATQRRSRMKIWQKCEHAMIPEMVRVAKSELAEGRSVPIFCNFTDTRQELGRQLNTKAGFYGGQNLETRQFYEREFQANRIHVLISNIGSGGASVSLHDLTGDRPRTAIIFPTDNPVHMTQATGRVDRVGGMTTSRQYIPFLAGTNMEAMVKRIRDKMRQISTLNDGVAAARI